MKKSILFNNGINIGSYVYVHFEDTELIDINYT